MPDDDRYEAAAFFVSLAVLIAVKAWQNFLGNIEASMVRRPLVWLCWLAGWALCSLMFGFLAGLLLG